MTPDTSLTFLTDMNVFWLVMSLGGGAFGAMVGANRAFGFCGVMIILGIPIAAGTGSTALLDYGAFGPVFGPQVSFAGAAAAAAYAGRRKLLPDRANGKDIDTALSGLGRPDVLLVGAVTGAIGYVLQRLIMQIPWFGTHTDSVTLTIVILGIATRLIFGRTGVFHSPTTPDDDAHWLRWQETPTQILTVSLFASMLASGLAVVLVADIAPVAAAGGATGITADAHVLPFAISALCVFFLAAKIKIPVTHHMTITAAFAAVTFFGIFDSALVAVALGTLFGVVAAFLAEGVARVVYNHGDTHIDPPASVIWVMNTVVALCALGAN